MMRHPFNRPRSYYVGAAALVLVGLVIGLGLSAGLNLQRPSTAARTTVALPASSVAPPESPFVSVVDRALPAVVFIDVRKKVGASSDDPQDDLFRRFFGPGHRMETRPSSGSGFIIDASGHILTNNHVVRNAEDITVNLNDKRSFKAKVVGTDPETDVAVLKIDADNLPVLPLGDSDQLRVGDWAIAIGNPLGQLQGSVTAGIISAKGRANLNIFGGTPSFQDFIQTDASINFGNSGGPLCNIRGEAIGVNTAINPSGQGIGFAIPINLAKHVAEQLIAHGSVKRAMIGVMLADLTPELAEGFGVKGAHGVIIQNVFKDTPAEAAGLKRNDIIVDFDGKPVSDMQKFRIRVADTAVGKRVPMTVLRDGKRVNTMITLSERNQNLLASNQPTVEEPSSSKAPGGIEVRELTSQERESAQVTSGVLITDITPGSPADDADLQPNDIVEEVGGKPVTTVVEFEKALEEAKKAGKPAVLLRNRQGSTTFVALRLDQE